MEVWIGRDGERHGPYQEDDIRQWLRSGQVSAADLGWYEGLADWQPLSVLFPDALAAISPAANPAGAAAMPPLPTLTAASLEDYAGFWQRVGAWIIDYLILLVPSTLVAMNMGAMAAVERLMAQMQTGITPAAITEYIHAVRPIGLVVIAIGFLYYALFECSKWQATPGKMALGLRVTGEDGGRIGIGRSMGRNAIRLANALIWIIPFIFYIAVAWSRRKQGLHDMIAGTLVLNGRAGEFKAPRPASGGSNTFSA